MTVEEWRVIIRDARVTATTLERVPDDADAISLARALNEWARFTASWVDVKEAEENE